MDKEGESITYGSRSDSLACRQSQEAGDSLPPSFVSNTTHDDDDDDPSQKKYITIRFPAICAET